MAGLFSATDTAVDPDYREDRKGIKRMKKKRKTAPPKTKKKTTSDDMPGDGMAKQGARAIEGAINQRKAILDNL